MKRNLKNVTVLFLILNADTTASSYHDIDGISFSWGGVLQDLQYNSLI